MIPLVSGLSEYGSKRAAPHEPRAPGARLTGRYSALLREWHTISEDLDSSEIETSLFSMVDESR